MSKTTEVPNGKTLREELVSTIVTQARTDPELFDELASNIADVLEDGDDENQQSVASQILGMKIEDEDFKQRVMQKVLKEYRD